MFQRSMTSTLLIFTYFRMWALYVERKKIYGNTAETDLNHPTYSCRLPTPRQFCTIPRFCSVCYLGWRFNDLTDWTCCLSHVKTGYYEKATGGVVRQAWSWSICFDYQGLYWVTWCLHVPYRNESQWQLTWDRWIFSWTVFETSVIKVF